MVDADGRDDGARVPTAAFSRLSATNVLFGWTWPQIGAGVAGLAMVVGGAAAGAMVLPLMLAGGVVMAYGLIRYEGLSLMAWTYVWLAWRRRVRDGSTRWSASPRPPRAGRRACWACGARVESRAQVGRGVRRGGGRNPVPWRLLPVRPGTPAGDRGARVEGRGVDVEHGCVEIVARGRLERSDRPSGGHAGSGGELKETALLLPGSRAGCARICPTMAGRRSGCAVIWRNCGPCRRS